MKAPRGDEREKDGQGVAADIAAERGRVDAAAEFSRLADRYLDTAYRLASVILGDPTEAEDAAHDAAVMAWRRFDTLRDRDRFEQWFCRIVVNVCRDRLRRRRVVRFVALDEGLGAHVKDPFEAALARVEVDRLMAVLDVEQRAIVLLRFWRDLPVDEIAARLGMPAGTVKSKLHYALRALRTAAERETPGGAK